MALFGSKKKNEAKAETPNETAVQSSIALGHGVAHVLKTPRITEKASVQQGMSVYTFDVATSATKTQIISAIRGTYKVTPIKVRVAQIPAKKTRSARTGRVGIKSGGKKAYVYLKKGETITVA